MESTRTIIWVDASVRDRQGSISVVAVRGEETIAKIADLIDIESGRTDHAEYAAIVRAVELVIAQDWSGVWVYSDCMAAISLVRNAVCADVPPAVLSHSEVRSACIERRIWVQHMGRKKNRAHRLAWCTLRQTLMSHHEDHEAKQDG